MASKKYSVESNMFYALMQRMDGRSFDFNEPCQQVYYGTQAGVHRFFVAGGGFKGPVRIGLAWNMSDKEMYGAPMMAAMWTAAEMEEGGFDSLSLLIPFCPRMAAELWRLLRAPRTVRVLPAWGDHVEVRVSGILRLRVSGHVGNGGFSIAVCGERAWQEVPAPLVPPMARALQLALGESEQQDREVRELLERLGA